MAVSILLKLCFVTDCIDNSTQMQCVPVVQYEDGHKLTCPNVINVQKCPT